MAAPTKVTTPPPRRTRAVDLQARPIRWAGAGNTRDGRLWRAFRAELMGHVGGKPTVTQRALIDRIAWLQLQLARMDERMMKDGGELSEHAGKQYLAWANATARMLAQLGFTGSAPPPPTLEDHLRSRRDAR